MKLQRIVVTLDPALRGRDVLEAAAEFAGRAQAELVGLFLENADLLHFAALPFAHEVCFPSAARRPRDVAGMQRALRALAEEVREALASAAGARAARWSFRVARGPMASALAEAGEADLVVWPLARTAEIASAGGVRVVRAGDIEALRAALESGGGAVVLAGESGGSVGTTLRRLLEEIYG